MTAIPRGAKLPGTPAVPVPATEPRSAVPVRRIELRTYALRECRPAAQDRVRLLWRMNLFEWPSADGGCTLKPSVGAAIFWPMV